MHMNEIRIMQRRNLGNYEHREVTLAMSLGENDDTQDAYERLNESIKIALGFGEGAQNVQKTAEESKPEAQAAPAKKPAAKKAAKKASTKKKAPAKKAPVAEENTYTREDLLAVCRNTANRLGSADKIKELIRTACGVDNLNDADPNTYGKLVGLLNAA